MQAKHPIVLIMMVLLAGPAASWPGTGEPDDQLWTELDVIGPVASNTTLCLTRDSARHLRRSLATFNAGPIKAKVKFRSGVSGRSHETKVRFQAAQRSVGLTGHSSSRMHGFGQCIAAAFLSGTHL